MDTSGLPIIISDWEGRLRDLDEIVIGLILLHDNINSSAYHDSTLYTRGQADALKAIIEYLEKV